jgi:LPS O-antigen subunit length determinant protein (WzzB/FepE family)
MFTHNRPQPNPIYCLEKTVTAAISRLIASLTSAFGYFSSHNPTQMPQHPWLQALQQEISLKQFFQLFGSILSGLWQYKKTWLLTAVLGAILGLVYHQFKPREYRAQLVLAAEEEKAAPYEGIAAQFGFDLGGGGGSTLFQGESLLRLFTTRQMIKRILLEPVDSNSQQLLADALFAYTKHADKEVFKAFVFDHAANSSLQDSALMLLHRHLTSEVLVVNKPDKKLSLFEVEARHENPQLAAAVVDRLVEAVSAFYIETLTFKSRRNLEILQAEYDSVQQVLNEGLMNSATAYDLNVNPSREALRVAGNRAMIDAEIAAKLFAEITKNLKLAEISLRKQTPLIQIIDPVSYPLEKLGWSWWKRMLAGSMGGFMLAIGWLYLKQRHA